MTLPTSFTGTEQHGVCRGLWGWVDAETRLAAVAAMTYDQVDEAVEWVVRHPVQATVKAALDRRAAGRRCVQCATIWEGRRRKTCPSCGSYSRSDRTGREIGWGQT